MTTTDQLPFRIEPADMHRMLTNLFGEHVRFDSGEHFLPQSRWRHIYRYRRVDGPDGVPEALIAKKAADREWSDGKETLTEWACLQFLSEEMGDSCPAPRSYGGDRQVPFFVMEDMGEGQDLLTILRGNDIERAKRVLIKFARGLGRIHAHTIGKEEKLVSIRNSIESIHRTITSPDELYRNYSKKLSDLCNAAGIEPDPRAHEELKALVRFRDPANPYRALTHWDLYPVNIYDSTERSKVFLYDYEFGRFEHLMVDAFQIRVYLDLWTEVSCFPDELMLEMENEYRAELASGCPEAKDDDWFFPSLIEGCLFETIHCIDRFKFVEPVDAVFSSILREDDDYDALNDSDYNHWGLPAVRRRMFYRLGLLARLAEEHNYLPSLGATARQIYDKFGPIWPEEVHEIPLYPAFR